MNEPSPDSQADVESVDPVARLLADAPSPRMPDAVWERLQAALLLESANRDAADEMGDRVASPTSRKTALDRELVEDE